jgi:large subunit ribosomal protein L15
LITEEIRLSDLNKMDASVAVIDLEALLTANLIRNSTKFAKVILFGKIERAITLRGMPITAGARKAVEEAGGKVEE